MTDHATAPSRVAPLLESVDRGAATLLTGPRGSGKSHLLRAVGAALTGRGRYAPVFTGNALGAGIPLGAFAGAPGLSDGALGSPGEVIDAFARRRSSTVLLVDDVDALDEASLYVVTQLVTTTGLPAVLAAQDLTTSPDPVRALYDRDDLTESVVARLSDAEATALVCGLVAGDMTPAALASILAAGDGNPLHLREIVRGSIDSGRLVETPHGWDLRGGPAPTARLAQLVGERFAGLDEASVDAAMLIAISEECPLTAIGVRERRALARADVIQVTAGDWVRLSHPLDAAYLRSQCSDALWHDLTHRAVAVLRSPEAASRPQARRRADVLALEHGLDFASDSVLALAEHALGAFDEDLALRAASAVTAVAPEAAHAHRIAGLAASALGRVEDADAHLDAAHLHARTDDETTSVALARAEHLGLRRHDATAACAVLEDAQGVVADEECSMHLGRAALRWAMVAGQGGDSVDAPEEVASAEAAMGLITACLSGVISGPLEESIATLPRLREVPAELLALIPGGHSLVDLTESMVLSYTGDVLATRRHLRGLLAASTQQEPESLGLWEYALGVLELLSADAEEAYALGQSAVAHLAWRDGAGVLPAAQALAGAAAAATGRVTESRKLFEAVPESAGGDPKVVMLRVWADAWHAYGERRVAEAARLLVETAQWLLEVQHTYFSGMLAHCAARLGQRTDEAAALLRTASGLAGGGLLRLLSRHADALDAGDVDALEVVAADARELGLVVTAADTWTWLAGARGRPAMSELRARRAHVCADELRAETPGMALWTGAPDRSESLTERERQVAGLAADRLTAKEIAEVNGVSVHTVTNQLASVFRKLGINSRAELRELLGTSGPPT